MFNFVKRLAASVSNPGPGRVRLYWNSTDDLPHVLNGDTGVDSSLVGVASVGANADGTLVNTGTASNRTLKRAPITGDVSIPDGSNTATLPTVNSNVGTFGSATAVPQVIVNAKGQVTGAANVNITGLAQADITGLVAALAAKAADSAVVHNTGNETVAGIKTFSSTIVGSVNGNAATVTTNANLTGDVTSVGNATTLPTVNGNVGTFGSASSVPVLIVNAKGQVTGVTNTSIAIGQAAVTNLVSDLAAKAADSAVVHNTGAETIAGVKTFSSTIVGSVNGNAATVTTNANLTGADVTSVGNATTLVNTGPGATGPIGSTSTVPVVTIDIKGRVTALTSAAIPASVPPTRTFTATSPIRIDAGGSADLSANRTLSILDAATANAGAMSARHFNQDFSINTAMVWLDDFTFTGGTNIKTGVNSAVAAVNAAVAALPAQGGIVWVNPGTYLIDTTVTLTKAGVTFVGLNRNNCIFTTNSATISMFTINEWFIGFERLSFDASVTRTAGYAINMPSAGGYAYGLIRDVSINNHFNGVFMGSNLGQIEALDIRTSPGAGAGITITGSSDRYLRNIRYDNASPIAGQAAILLKQCGSLILQDSNLIHADIALWINPDDGVTVPSVEVTNTFFDNCGAAGVKFDKTGTTGTIYRSKFTNCWFSSSSAGHGVWFNNVNTDGISFSNCDFYGNSSRGIYAQAVTEFSVHGCRIAGNATAGIETVAASTMQFTIIGSTIGPTAGFFGTQASGITVGAGTYAGYLITDNDLRGNTTALTAGGSAPGRSIVKDNLGLVVSPAPSPAATLLPITTVTKVANSVFIPANTLRVGTVIKAYAVLSKVTTTANAAATARLTYNTTDVSTTALVTYTFAGSTALAGNGVLIYTFVVRAIGASGTAVASIILDNEGTTGLANASRATVAIPTINTTVDNYLGIWGSSGVASDHRYEAVYWEIPNQ